MDASKVRGEMEEGDNEDVILPACRLRPRKAKLAHRRKSKNMGISCKCHLKYCNNGASPSSTSTAANIDEDEERISAIPFACHAVFIFLDPILVGLVQAEYQNKPQTPFEAHPLQMWTFIAALCAYSTVLGVKFYVKNHSGFQARILSHVLLLSGSLSSASLLSIFLPLSLVWLLLVIWVSLPFIMARQLLKILLSWVVKWTRKVWDSLISISVQSQQHLPQ